jgi:hypothetical protein
MSTDKSTKDVGQVKVRMPEALKIELAARAKHNRRTVSMEVVRLLELGVRTKEQIAVQ